MLPLLVACLVAVAWAPTRDVTSAALPSWADEYSRFEPSARLLRLLWIFWHLHAIYLLARQQLLTVDLLSHVLFAWAGLKFWSYSFFSESMPLMAYLVATLWLLTSALLQARGVPHTQRMTNNAEEMFLDMVAALTLGAFAVWNFDVLQRILRRKKRKKERVRIAIPGRQPQDGKNASRRVRDKRWQPPGMTKR